MFLLKKAVKKTKRGPLKKWRFWSYWQNIDYWKSRFKKEKKTKMLTFYNYKNFWEPANPTLPYQAILKEELAPMYLVILLLQEKRRYNWSGQAVKPSCLYGKPLKIKDLLRFPKWSLQEETEKVIQSLY